MLIEIFAAVCMYATPDDAQMTCHRDNSQWWDSNDIVKVHPDPGNHYKTPTCWVVDRNRARILMDESCESFNKRLKSL